jgi:hypothetical protein
VVRFAEDAAAKPAGASFEASLTPIQRYALCFVEDFDALMWLYTKKSAVP